LDRIRESTSNPRRVFDDMQLRELAANIQSHGVLQPIVVRPSPDGADGMYELVAGARRFRASKLAGKNTIPATVRNLTDAEAHEVRLIENLQGENIHELDEGIGYRSLMDLRPDFYTVETIAAQVAKSPSYVRGRISLAELTPAARTAFMIASSRSLMRWRSRGSSPGIKSVRSWNVFQAIGAPARS
jgi:ParB family chromosome partitioning protein